MEILLEDGNGGQNIKQQKSEEQTERHRVPSTTIAEEAVDQLQASEKLIAGKLILFIIQFALLKTI